MRVTTIVRATCLFAVLVLSVTTRGGVVTFTGGSLVDPTDWHDPTNWSSNPLLPGPADRVVIPAQQTAYIWAGNVTVDTVEIEGSIVVLNGYCLTLQNDNDNAPSSPDGSYIGEWAWLTSSSTNSTHPQGLPGVVRFEVADHEVRGPGDFYMIGQLGGRIEIAAGVRLINDMEPQSGQTGHFGAIHGWGIIQGDEDSLGSPPQHGMLLNRGRVMADFDLTIGEHTLLEDIEGAQWTLKSEFVSFAFMSEAINLQGDFDQFAFPSQSPSGCAEFVFYESVMTCGTYQRSGTRVQIASPGKSFSYAAFADPLPRACGNPGMVANAGLPASCTNPYVVTATTNVCYRFSTGWALVDCPYCRADVTGSAISGNPNYGVPDFTLNNDDFFYYIAEFSANNVAACDFTHTAVAGSPGYGVPNGILNNDDYFFYLALFGDACPIP